MASTALCTSPKAVMITTGTVGSARRTPSSTSMPSTSFMRRSVITTSAGSPAKRSRALAPPPATSVSKPTCCRSLAMVSAMSTTSSTTSTLSLRTGRLRVNGPEDGHRGPLALGAGQVDLAAVVADDAGDDGEAEAGPLAPLLGGEERVEDGVQVLEGDPAALVDDLERDLGAGPAGAQPEQASGVGGVAGVEQQVDQHLLQLIGVGGQGGQIRRQLRLEPQAPRLELPLQELAGPAHDALQGHRPPHDRLPPGEVEELADGRGD